MVITLIRHLVSIEGPKAGVTDTSHMWRENYKGRELVFLRKREGEGARKT